MHIEIEKAICTGKLSINFSMLIGDSPAAFMRKKKVHVQHERKWKYIFLSIAVAVAGSFTIVDTARHSL